MASNLLFYVSVNGSDSNNGLTIAKAFATIEKAISMLRSGTPLTAVPGVVQLLAGEFYAPPAGCTLEAGQAIYGVGATASKINGRNVTGGAVLTLSGSRSAARDLWVTNVPPSKVGVRVTHVSPDPPIPSNENSRLDNIFVDSLGTDAIAFGIGDDTASDVSELCMTACCSVGNGKTSYHMQIGNGAVGNVLDISNFGGNSQAHKYGVVVNGGSLVSVGMCFQGSKEADIWIRSGSPIGAVSIRGGRSENSLRFVKSEIGLEAMSVVEIADYSVVQMQNVDGIAIQMTHSPTSISNVALAGANCPQFIDLAAHRTDGPYGSMVDVAKLATQHPYPFRSPWSRPGKIVRASGMRFIGLNSTFETLTNKTSTNFVRRYNVIPQNSGKPYSLNPAFFDSVEIRLGANAGTFTLPPGVPGQILSITFDQDGVGTRSYSWPGLCAFSGGRAPANVTTARNRQTGTFEWNGRYWEQRGAITNVLPPTIAANPVWDKFSSGEKFWLSKPSVGAFNWEHIPGGGSVGIAPPPPLPLGGPCKCNSLGWIGDNGADTGFYGQGAGAVIETGMTTTPDGIQAMFVWQATETVIAHYLDDQTFQAIWLYNGFGTGRVGYEGYSRGAVVVGTSYRAAPVEFIPGSTHALRVKLTATGFEIWVDGGLKGTVAMGDDQPKFADLTKHGFVLSSRDAMCKDFSVS